MDERKGSTDRIVTPADLSIRPLYVPIVDEKVVRPVEALVHYHFGEDYPCGLASCRTLHRDGYLVSTTDGKETNIGSDCGRKYFGDSFVLLVNQLNERSRRAANIGAVERFLLRWPELDGQIHLLRNKPKGTSWAQSAPKRMLTKLDKFVTPVTNDLRMRAQKGNYDLTDSIPLSYQEKEDHKAKFPSQKVPQFRNVLLGRFKGLKTLISFPDSQLADVVGMHTELSRLSLDTLSAKALADWSKKLGGIEMKIAEAEAAITEAENFLADENWSLILRLAEQHKKKAHNH